MPAAKAPRKIFSIEILVNAGAHPCEVTHLHLHLPYSLRDFALFGCMTKSSTREKLQWCECTDAMQFECADKRRKKNAKPGNAGLVLTDR